MRLGLLGLAVGLCACTVDTALPDGTLLCGAEGRCPGGQVCEAGVCVVPLPPGTPTFSAVRVAPCGAGAGERLAARPIGLRHVSEAAPVQVDVVWRDAAGVERATSSWRLPGGEPSPGPALDGDDGALTVEMTLSAEGRVVARATSAWDAALPAEPRWSRDRPRRATSSVGAAAAQVAPAAAFDEAGHRLWLAVPGESALWALDLDPASGTAAGAAFDRRWIRFETASAMLHGEAAPLALAAADDGFEIFGITGDSCSATRTARASGTGPPPDRVFASADLVLAVWSAPGELRLRAFPAGSPCAECETSRAVSGDVALAWDADASALFVVDAGGLSVGRAVAGAGAGADAKPPAGDAGRQDAAVAFDAGPTAGDAPPRDATVVFDAEARPTTGDPPGRDAAVAFDAARRRLLAWGGCADEGCATRDPTLRALDLGTLAWRTIDASAGDAPPAGPARAFVDPIRDALVVVAHDDDGALAIHGLPLDGGPWIDLDPHPGARQYLAATRAGDTLVVHGGRQGPPDAERLASGEVWIGRGGVWRALSATAGPRTGGVLVAWPAGAGTAWLIGGERADGARTEEVFVVDPTADRVSPLGTTGPLGARAYHRAAAGPTLRVFGGFGPEGLGIGAPVELESGSAWREVPGLAPPARLGHGLAWEASTASFLVTSGTGADGADLGDLWRCPPAGDCVEQTVVPPLPPRVAHATASLGRGRLLLWGGTSRQGEALLLCHRGGDAWRSTPLPVPDDAHCGYEGLVAIYDPARDAVDLIGGANEAGCDGVSTLRPVAPLDCPD